MEINMELAQKSELKNFQPDAQTDLAYRYWNSDKKAKRAIIVLHRGHEHSGRVVHIAESLIDAKTQVFAWDARGHGLSTGVRGYAKNFGELVKDLDAFVHHISENYEIKIEDIAIVAQSVGAVIAATWVHDYAPKIRALVLASPALRVKLYVPFAIPALRLANRFGLMKTVQSYVKSKLLTHDPERQASYDSDKLITQQIATNILIDLYDTSTRLINDAGAITVPTLVLTSGSDWVVRKDVQRKFFERLGSTTKEMHEFKGFYHDTLGELEAEKPLNISKNFLNSQFDRDRDYSPNIPYTHQEFYMLSASAGPIKSLAFSAIRTLMFSVGRLSDGINTGIKTGFDSGVMLDYVYKNKAQGGYGIGKLMDRSYLDSYGWKGIRVRGKHIEQMVVNAVDRLNKDNSETKLVEIAAGQGRYILNGLAKAEMYQADILLRDFDNNNVQAIERRLVEEGFENAIAKQGDAFDESSMDEIPADRTLGVVSGLYELFPENELVSKSLQLLSSKMQTGGYLIYTGQPYHPQLEFIARVLTSHRGGDDWVMRRRTQAEMDQLVEQAGFEKVDMLIDEWGIFTVSLAQKK